MADVIIAENGEKKQKKQKKLGHEELLRLLSVFEGELQGECGFYMFINSSNKHVTLHSSR